MLKPTPIIKFENIKTGADYFLKTAVNIDWSKKLYQQITDICNQDKVYNILFSYKFNKRKYTLGDAMGFVEHKKQDWQDNSSYNYFIFDEEDNLCGSIEIKSVDKSITEIGYWADENHKGIMTPAVRIIIDLAKQAGYKGLFARVRFNNQGSQRVLLNNGFIFKSNAPLKEDKIERYLYELKF